MKKQPIFKDLPRVLITGGLGFIASEFVRQAIKRGYRIIVVDKITYAGDRQRLRAVKGRYKFYKADICNASGINSIFKRECPEVVVNFAAETHVDRSIHDSSIFLKTNVIGTRNMLDVSKKYNIKKFIHISTDEVYGEIRKGRFFEGSSLRPNSPYAASKACCDLLINSYVRTYDFPAVIVRPSNNYGPWQYPEKLIPVIIYKALKNNKIPIYARGLNVREWLYVSDCAAGILAVMSKGKRGEVYNLGSGQGKRNIDVARAILNLLGRPQSLIQYVKDRPGHDYRYCLDSSRIRKLGWRPKVSFQKGISETVNWYKQNPGWLENKARYLKDYWKKVYKKE